MHQRSGCHQGDYQHKERQIVYNYLSRQKNVREILIKEKSLHIHFQNLHRRKRIATQKNHRLNLLF
jgi:hypothetical protein